MWVSQRYVCEKYYIRNPATFRCENGRYLAIIIDDFAITFDELIESYNEETKTIRTNFNEKNPICQRQIFYILLAFLLITIAVMIAVIVFCSLLKDLLPFVLTNDELKEIIYW